MPRSSRKRPALARSSGPARGTSTIGNPERLSVKAPSLPRWSRMRLVLAQRTARSSSPLASLTPSPTSTLASEATGEGARVQVRGGRDLEQALELGRAGDEGQQRRVGLGEAAGEARRGRSARSGGG